MSFREKCEDACRDFSTRIDGLFGLFKNIAIRIRQPTAQLPWHNFQGKVCIVTGGNAGVGSATAEAMVARGARVILACRDDKRAKVAAEALDATPSLAGCQKHPVETGALDLASLSSVRSFASSFNSRGLPLALLICNAGIMAPPKRLVTKDGLEQQFQVNYLGHWLLTHELLAGQHRLQHNHKAGGNQHAASSSKQTQARHQHDSSSPVQQNGLHGNAMAAEQSLQPSTALQEGTRVVMLSSLTHKAGRIRFDDLDAHQGYSGFHRYADSKLAELLAVKEFAHRMDRGRDTGTKDSIVAVHPGLLQTELARGWLKNGCPRFLRPISDPVIDFLFPKTFLPPEYAVQSILYAATAPSEEVHGKYVADCKVVQPARHARDDSTARRLWDVSCQLTNISPHAM